MLVRYPWPGNVRELENAIKRYVVLGDERHLRDELELRLATQLVPVGAWAVDAALSDGLRSIGRRAARDAEAVVIRAVLERVKGNRAEAARRLRVSEKTLLAKLHEVGMAPRRGARSFEC